MMAKLFSASDIIKILKQHDYVLVRQKGSHMQFKNEKGVRVTIPFHAGDKPLHPKIIKTISKDTEIEF